MYYIVTENGVINAPNIKLLEKKINGSLKPEDFKAYGRDKIITMSNENIEFIQDVKVLENIPMQKLFTVDKLAKLMQIAMLIMLVVILIKK